MRLRILFNLIQSGSQHGLESIFARELFRNLGQLTCAAFQYVSTPPTVSAFYGEQCVHLAPADEPCWQYCAAALIFDVSERWAHHFLRTKSEEGSYSNALPNTANRHVYLNGFKKGI